MLTVDNIKCQRILPQGKRKHWRKGDPCDKSAVKHRQDKSYCSAETVMFLLSWTLNHCSQPTTMRKEENKHKHNKTL